MSDLLSVLTPVYNGEKFVRRCYESLLAQTFQNWEWVVVDDGSTDDTRRIVESISAQDPRVRVSGYARNRGRGYARMQTIQRARGSWVAIWDVDDAYFPHRLSHIHDARARGFDFFCSYALIVDNALRTKGVRGFYSFLGLRTFVHATLACRRELAETIGYEAHICTVGQIGEDHRIGLVLPSKYRGCYHPGVLMINQEDREVFLRKAIDSNTVRLKVLKQLHAEGVFPASESQVRAQLNKLRIRLCVLHAMRLKPSVYLKTVSHRSFGEVEPGYRVSDADLAYLESWSLRHGPSESAMAGTPAMA